MAWAGNSHILGIAKAAKGIVADLPTGSWAVKRFDVIARDENTPASDPRGTFTFDAPDAGPSCSTSRRPAGSDPAPGGPQSS